MNRGFDYILSCVKPDGSIQKAGMANYNTSLSLMALTSAADTNFLPVILKAREFIASTQIDMGVKGTNDTPFDGGVGYGSKYDHSDMNNTLAAIEAMRASEALLPKDVPASAAQLPDLDWKAVAHFLQNCQNLPGTNTADWVSSDPKDRGGFVYYPGRSMAGGVTNSQTGKVALRSYVWALAASGSDVYAGGFFTTAGGSAANRIAKWDGSSWSALGEGMSDYVGGLAVSGSDVYAAGGFTKAGGSPAYGIAKWNGSSWSALGTGIGGGVSALAASGSDLYVGGDFTTAGGSPATNIAKWNGSSWSALGAGVNSSVFALAVSGSDVYAGGWFTTAGGSPANQIAKWDGSSWSALGSGIIGGLYALAVSGSNLYVGGNFATAGGKLSLNMARANVGDVIPGPQLSILLSGGEVILSWPSSTATNFVLQATASLLQTNGWANVSDTPGVVSNAFAVTNALDAAGKYYRLKSP